jgi:tetratricopeptide (TPR) repeat protein
MPGLRNDESAINTLQGDLNNLGIGYAQHGEYSKASFYLEESLKLAKLLDLKKEQAKIHSNLAALYYYLGKDNTSLDYSDKGLKIAHEINDHTLLGRLHTNQATNYEKWGQYEKALST